MTHTTSSMTVWDRVGAASGAAYVLLILVGNQLAMGGSIDPHPTGAQDLTEFSASPTATDVVGFTMEFLGFLVFLFFLAWLVHALRRHGVEAGWLAGVVGFAGVTTVAVKLASVMPMTAGRLDHAELSPASARVLADMNSAAFVISFLTFGTFLFAAGLAILASGFLGRLAGWVAVILGLVGVLLTLAAKVDPLNANPMPFLAGLIWVLVVSVRLTWKGSVGQIVEPVEPPTVVPA